MLVGCVSIRFIIVSLWVRSEYGCVQCMFLQGLVVVLWYGCMCTYLRYMCSVNVGLWVVFAVVCSMCVCV